MLYSYIKYYFMPFILLFFVIILVPVNICFASSVILNWNPNTEADLAGYKIYYKADVLKFPFGSADVAQGPSPIDISNQTTFTITGLDPNLNYYFAVTAYNLDGVESAFSNIVFVPKSSSTTSSDITFTYDDAILALRAAVGKVVLTLDETARLDVAPVVNGVSAPNARVDAADAIVIMSRMNSKTPI